AGIGPEICLHLLNNQELAKACTPVVFGDASVLERVAQEIRIPFNASVISRDAWATAHGNVVQPVVLDLGYIGGAEVLPGQVHAQCGDAAFRYVIASIEAGIAGEVSAVATAPLNKEAMHAAGHR